MKKLWHFSLLAVCAVGLSACYIVQPAPGTNVVIQNPQR